MTDVSLMLRMPPALVVCENYGLLDASAEVHQRILDALGWMTFWGTEHVEMMLELEKRPNLIVFGVRH